MLRYLGPWNVLVSVLLPTHERQWPYPFAFLSDVIFQKALEVKKKGIIYIYDMYMLKIQYNAVHFNVSR